MNNEDNQNTPTPEETQEVFSTQLAPTDSSTPTPPPLEQPKKSKKGLIISLVVALIVIVGAGLVYFLLFKPADTKTDTPAANSAPEATNDYAKALIAKVRSDQEALDPESTKLSIEDYGADGFPVSSPAYKQHPDQYYMIGNFGTGLTLSDKDPNPDYSVDSPNQPIVLETLNKTFSTDDTLKKTIETVERSGPTTVYQNDNVICSFAEYYPLIVSCANKKDYKNLAKELEPFADALFLVLGEKNKALSVLRQPTITTKDTGYSNASIDVSEVSGYSRTDLFYGKDGNWTYWRGIQNTLKCDYFNTYALQASFKGDTCYEKDGTERKVEITL